MMTWDQTDRLNEIANDRTKTSEERFREIQDRMQDWHIALYSCIPVTTAFSYVPDIDPYAQSRAIDYKKTGRY